MPRLYLGLIMAGTPNCIEERATLACLGVSRNLILRLEPPQRFYFRTGLLAGETCLRFLRITMVTLFTALLLIGIFAAVFCHVQGSSAFTRMVISRSDADSDAYEAEWKRWRQLQFHVSLGIVVFVCGLAQLLK